MPTSSVPLDIKKFLTDHFDSVTQLETLFTFYTLPEKTWTPDSMSKELRNHPTSSGKIMQNLAEQGFIKRLENDRYVYSPRENLVEMVRVIHALFQARPVAIIACIYEKPQDKLKGFVDAFKFKKD